MRRGLLVDIIVGKGGKHLNGLKPRIPRGEKSEFLGVVILETRRANKENESQ
jgi:hypothetical protein